MNQPLVMFLAGYREHSLDKSAVRWLFESDEPEEGTDGGQSQVASADTDRATLLHIIKKSADRRSSEILQIEA
jgi:hypothetical protein